MLVLQMKKNATVVLYKGNKMKKETKKIKDITVLYIDVANMSPKEAMIHVNQMIKNVEKIG